MFLPVVSLAQLGCMDKLMSLGHTFGYLIFKICQLVETHEAFTHIFINKWAYFTRPIPKLGILIQPRVKSLKPYFTGQSPNKILEETFQCA